MLPEEVWILERHHLLVITCPCPRPIDPHTYLTVPPSSGSLIFSSMTHGPILLLSSFIPTYAYCVRLMYFIIIIIIIIIIMIMIIIVRTSFGLDSKT